MLQRMGVIIVMVLCMLAIVPSSIDGHIPLDTSGVATRDRPILVEDHWISWAAYKELERSGDIHYYHLVHVEKGDKISLHLLVPEIDRLKDFHLVIALIGPGITTDWGGLEGNALMMELEIEEGEGALVIPFTDETHSSFYEPFTQTRYWNKQKLDYDVEEDGDFYVAVFDVGGDRGKYVLSIGEVERWGLKDILRMPRIWWDVRMFMEREEATYRTVGVFASVVLLLGIYLVLR